MSRAFAPAKINLYLHVTGRRDDGYHLLDSLIVFADVEDIIEVEESRHLSLEIDGPFSNDLSTGEDNLVIRAARLLADSTGMEPRAAIRLTKNLPVASGIGGGSADAAATLKALMDHWHLSIPEDALQRMALTLGADVPVCLAGNPSYIGGIGEDIDAAPNLPPAWLMLVNPGVAVSTPTIFNALTANFSEEARLGTVSGSAQELARALTSRHNDLTGPAIALEPVIEDVLAALDGCDGVLLSRLSGSGATCFGLFADEDQAGAGAEQIRRRHPNWWVQPTRILEPGTAP